VRLADVGEVEDRLIGREQFLAGSFALRRRVSQFPDGVADVFEAVRDVRDVGDARVRERTEDAVDVTHRIRLRMILSDDAASVPIRRRRLDSPQAWREYQDRMTKPEPAAPTESTDNGSADQEKGDGSSPLKDWASPVIAAFALLVSGVSVLVSIFIANGTISVPQESLPEKFQGRRVTGFGLECRTDRNQECIATWTIHEIKLHTTNRHGDLIGTLEYGFGSKLRIEGRASGSILRFKGTKVITEASSSPRGTDKGCQYYVAPSGTDPKEFIGYWSGCEGDAEGKEGRMFLTLDV
jgi:hypothetical protein